MIAANRQDRRRQTVDDVAEASQRRERAVVGEVAGQQHEIDVAC